MTTKNPSGRLTQWSLLLQEFDITLKHRPGIRNLDADALSRLPHDASDATSSCEEMPLFLADDQRKTIKFQE